MHKDTTCNAKSSLWRILFGIDGGIAFAAGVGDKMAELMSQNQGAMFLSTCTDSAKWPATGSFPVEDVESKIDF